MTYKIIALIIVVFLIAVCDSLFIVAKRSDERAERMYEEWRRKRGQVDKY